MVRDQNGELPIQAAKATSHTHEDSESASNGVLNPDMLLRGWVAPECTISASMLRTSNF